MSGSWATSKGKMSGSCHERKAIVPRAFCDGSGSGNCVLIMCIQYSANMEASRGFRRRRMTLIVIQEDDFRYIWRRQFRLCASQSEASYIVAGVIFDNYLLADGVIRKNNGRSEYYVSNNKWLVISTKRSSYHHASCEFKKQTSKSWD
jgi:hypothetical protein